MVKVINTKKKRIRIFANEVWIFMRLKWRELWNPKPEIEVNTEIKKMQDFIIKNYSPKDQAKVVKGLKTGILANLNAEAIAADKRAKDCREAILLINKN